MNSASLKVLVVPTSQARVHLKILVMLHYDDPQGYCCPSRHLKHSDKLLVVSELLAGEVRLLMVHSVDEEAVSN